MKRILYLGNTLNQGTARGKKTTRPMLRKSLLVFFNFHICIMPSFTEVVIMGLIHLFRGNLHVPKFAGSAVGFKLDSLLKLTDTRASNSKMTLMHYLCKVQVSLMLMLELVSWSFDVTFWIPGNGCRPLERYLYR